MLNLHRDKIVRREPGRDGKILSDHRHEGNDEVHRLQVRLKKKQNKKGSSIFRPVAVVGWRGVVAGCTGTSSPYQVVREKYE